MEEEAGFKISRDRIISSNKYVATTQMNERVYTFLVNLNNLEQHEYNGDGSFFENIAENHWLTQKQLEKILYDNKEPYLVCLYIAYDLFKRKILNNK